MMKRKPLDFGESREDKFMLPGIDFKAKMIGIESVAEARGDKMCMDTMIRLKYHVKASGGHKARIIVNVSIEGIRILDERTREVLHQNEVHKISFISRDPTDLRAFGYVHGEQGKHKFYAIKTEKQADNLVLTLKELFEVVLELKKGQIAEQKKAEQISGLATQGDTNAAPQQEKTQASSFKNPPPAEGGEPTEAIYAQVNKPTKLSELAANLSDESNPPSSGLLDLEQEVMNLQMGIDTMDQFDLHPQTPTSPQADLFASPPAQAPAPASDPFALAGPPQTQRAPVAKAAGLDSAFGSSDPFAVQATPTIATNSAAPPPAAGGNDLFQEFKDTFTVPTPQQVNARQPMVQPAPNPFGGMQPAPAAPFQANFGGTGATPAAFGGAPGGFGAGPAAFGGAPGGFGAAPAAFGGAPGGFGAPPPMQQPADPFGGGAMFDNNILTPDSTATPQDNLGKSDPFSDLGVLSSAKEDAPKSNKELFANYKIGKPGEPKAAPEIKLTGGPRRPPPAIPTSPQSNPFGMGGAPVTNGTNAGGNDLFGNSFDTFDFSNPNQ